MSMPEHDSQAIRPPNYLWSGLIIGCWIVLSSIVLVVADEHSSPRNYQNALSIIFVASIFIYMCLYVRHGWIMIPIAMLSVSLQCGGCLHLVGYRSGLSSPVRAVCGNNLHSIGHALAAYHELYGTFPPAYTADKKGQPLYCWTVPILPFLEEVNLYEKINLQDPWNSSHNHPFTERRIVVLECPAHKPYRYRNSSNIGYICVIGRDTAWPGAVGRPLSQFTDGPAETILLFEVAALDIPWAAPQMLTLDQAIELFTKSDPHGPSSRHDPPNISVLMADGSTRSLPGDIPPETLRAMLTVNGGETVVIPKPAPESSLP